VPAFFLADAQINSDGQGDPLLNGQTGSTGKPNLLRGKPE